ncbi:phytoene/squalene synthase family protein [Nocardioides sp. Y6]|uniref:Phytoene/squalene synthase family protein n=1 Tax=Nocardioides malaquae TaxID=2773426 RepID=A0ABR9RV28_9ACTN|nr:phytoene/squalene synthase family protein [Nocardioides malaquae]MBE7325220.1 phytoene/squalene synthase family protein [Nocardioides malaquae]
MSHGWPSPRHRQRHAPTAPHELYDQVAEGAADIVIRRYSTSFGIASRLLAEPVRTHVRNIYALVRVADEIVDAPRPEGSPVEQARLLDELEAQVAEALRTGHSANLVVHAFARTARHCGIEMDLVAPFFASMRMDLDCPAHDEETFAAYVYGSAEVVGLMCLRTFVMELDDPQAAYEEMYAGARALGAGFQKVNFLRDLAADVDTLGRCYFPGVDVESFDQETRDRLLDDIDADLATAASVVPQLPVNSRRAVRAAHALFAELARELRRTPPAVIRRQRVRVTGARKARVLALAMARRDA